MTDGELVELVRAGDTTAFGELVLRHRGAIYRAALAALRNPADAEDVAQEALVLAFRKIGQFRGDASVRTWMVTIGWHHPEMTEAGITKARRPCVDCAIEPRSRHEEYSMGIFVPCLEPSSCLRVPLF